MKDEKKNGVLDVTLQILNATDAAAAVTAACPVQMHQHFSGIRRWREKKRRRKEEKKKRKRSWRRFVTWLGRQTDLSFRLHGGLLRGREVHYSSLIRARRANETGGKVPTKDETRKDMDGGMDVKREDTSLTRSWSIDGGNPRFCQITIDLNICLHRITFLTLSPTFLQNYLKLIYSVFLLI